MTDTLPTVEDIFTNAENLGLGDALEPVRLKQGEVLFHEGDVADALYYVKAGSVRIELEQGEIDSDAVLAHVTVGGIVGELGILDRSPRSASAIADTSTELLRLSLTTLSHLEDTRPAQAIWIYRVIGAAATAKLRRGNARLASAIFRTRDPEVERQVGDARAAQVHLADATEEAVEALLEALADAFETEAENLARLTVEKTGMGNVADKTRKNRFASRTVRETLRGRTGCGPLTDRTEAVVEFASPAGVVFGLIPVTNPVATAIFKCLICLKSRNALILSFPRRAAGIGEVVDELITRTLKEYRWPTALVQAATRQNSRRRTEAFFNHPGVDLILATGGPSMVEAAYRSGRPAIGVGAGNAPVLICADADVEVAARMVVESKSFDNGLICGSEHNLVVVESIAQIFRESLEAAGAVVLTVEESRRFSTHIFNEGESRLRHRWIGESATHLAVEAGLNRTTCPRIIVVPASVQHVRGDHILAREKMAPILSLFTVSDEEHGMELCQRLLSFEGRGHTAVIHTHDRSRAEKFAICMPASRILVNTPATHGVIGLTTGLRPSLTLGCGLFGGNSTNDNVDHTHVRNTKRMAFHHPPMESF